MSDDQIFLVAAEVTRLNSIADFQLEPPHVGCYQSNLPVRRLAIGGAVASLFEGLLKSGRQLAKAQRLMAALAARAWHLVVLLASLAALLGGGRGDAAEEWVPVRPTDTGEALVNPGMGWTLQFYSNLIENYGSKLEPADTLDDWPGLSVIYLRVPWSFLEPKEGEFNWPLLDTPAQRWIAKGKKIALRVTCCEMKNLRVGQAGQIQVEKLQARFTVAYRHEDATGVHVPPVKPGAYDVFVSVGQRDGTPQISLPLPFPDGQRRYKVGQIKLK